MSSTPRRNQNDTAVVHPQVAYERAVDAIKDASIALRMADEPDYTVAAVPDAERDPGVITANTQAYTQRLQALQQLSDALQLSIYADIIASQATSDLSYRTLSRLCGRSTTSLQAWVARDMLAMTHLLSASPAADAPGADEDPHTDDAAASLAPEGV